MVKRELKNERKVENKINYNRLRNEVKGALKKRKHYGRNSERIQKEIIQISKNIKDEWIGQERKTVTK